MRESVPLVHYRRGSGFKRLISAPLTSSPFYSDIPWEVIQTSSAIRWQTRDESAGSVANPLRWGWLYNFGFTSNVAPVTAEVLMDSHADSPFSTLTALTQAPPPPLNEPLFRRGLCNFDDLVDVSDVMFLLDYQFSGGSEPGCLDACDCNDDGVLDLSDAINLLGYLFWARHHLHNRVPSLRTDPSMIWNICRPVRCP